jgi:DNA-binding response OmpR family regulator
MHASPLSILLVEDHLPIARQVTEFLEGLGWRIDYASSGTMAIGLARRETYDVVVLDLNLPDIDGLQVCREIKAHAATNVPVLMLTARDAYEDKARGFKEGADDYLCKPFDLRELVLRCEAMARRSQLHVRQQMQVGPLLLMTKEMQAAYGSKPLALTQTGFKILLLLCQHHPHAVSRSALIQHVWGASPPDSDALKSHIYQLRKQLEQTTGRKILTTIHQLGYRLDLDDTAGHAQVD